MNKKLSRAFVILGCLSALKHRENHRTKKETASNNGYKLRKRNISFKT